MGVFSRAAAHWEEGGYGALLSVPAVQPGLLAAIVPDHSLGALKNTMLTVQDSSLVSRTAHASAQDDGFCCLSAPCVGVVWRWPVASLAQQHTATNCVWVTVQDRIVKKPLIYVISSCCAMQTVLFTRDSSGGRVGIDSEGRPVVTYWPCATTREHLLEVRHAWRPNKLACEA